MKKIKSLYHKLSIILTGRERKLAFLVLLLSLLTGLAQSASVVLVLPFINVVFDPSIIQSNEILRFVYELFDLQRTLTFLIVLGSFIFIAVIGANAMMVLTIYAKTRFVTMRNHHLSKKLLDKYLLAPYRFFLNRNSSELSKNVLDEVNQFTNGFLMALFDILIHGFMLLAVLITIFVIDPLATLTAVAVFGGLYGSLMLFFQRRLKAAGEARLLANKERYRLSGEALSSIKTTKVLGKELYYLDSYSEASYAFAKNNAYARIVSALPRYIIEGVAFGGLVLFVVIQLSIGRSLDSLVPIVGVLGLAGYRMLPALQQVFSRYSTFIYHIPILNKLVEELSEPSEYDAHIHEAVVALPFENQISLKNITFKYDASQSFQLNNIDMSIQKNQIVGVMGETGSGKSTLIDILMGLLKPSEGHLMIDDTQVQGEMIRAWQALIGYVPQDIYLSDNSLAANIAFGENDDSWDMARIKKAAQIAAIDSFIEHELDAGYETFVGERGVRLSGGQRQRIGIARALYRNPEVIIFDEATSALDNATEKEVLKAINNASKNRTVVMIAHRLNTLKDCDVIYQLDHGKIIASGTYKDIVNA